MLEPGFYLMDCMDGMRQFPDSFFDLAIVDPPYGMNITGKHKIGGGIAHSLEGDHARSAVTGSYGKGRPRIGGGITMKGESRSSKSRLRPIMPSTTPRHRTKGIFRSWRGWQNNESSGAAIS